MVLYCQVRISSEFHSLFCYLTPKIGSHFIEDFLNIVFQLLSKQLKDGKEGGQ